MQAMLWILSKMQVLSSFRDCNNLSQINENTRIPVTNLRRKENDE
jgi:hypothetical protein